MNPRAIDQPGTWDALRARFEWRVPKQFSMADVCCDHWALADPDRTAVIDLDENGKITGWSFAALKRASDRFARVLQARGVGLGDRVAILLQQSPEVLITHFAAMKLGAIVLPLFALFGPDALRYRLADSGAKVLVTSPDQMEKIEAIQPELPDLKEVYLVGETGSPFRSFWGDIDAAQDGFERAITGPDDPAMLIYTSGTTGDPKGAVQAHRSILGHLPSVELQHEFLPQPGDVAWTPADWAWIGGLMDLAMPALYHGVPVVAYRMRKFDPDEAYRLIAAQGSNVLFLPPTALKLMRQAKVPNRVKIRSVASGGESLGEDLHAWGAEALGAPINEIYGQTECNLVIGTCHGAMELRPGTMGLAVPGHEVAILGPDDRLQAPGEVGEICVKAPDPVMFLGYWGKPDATAEKVQNGWLRTGDLGTVDADGYFTFVSRDDDVITSAGYRIGPVEIENCLLGDADVVMAAVVGLPDPVRTESVTAFVVARDGQAGEGLSERLIARVRQQISPHLAPREIRFVDALPMTATGKILRRSLRDQAT